MWRGGVCVRVKNVCYLTHCQCPHPVPIPIGRKLLLLLVSLHHTFVIHCFTHLCAVSLYISRSSVVHASGRRGQFSKCSIVCGSSVQSHVVSSSQYPHLFILYLHLPTLVLSLLRHCHSHHGNEDPVANDSDGVMFSCVGVDCRWLVHADNLFSEGLHVMGWTECTKLFLDLRRFVGAIWPYRECLLSVVCFSCCNLYIQYTHKQKQLW